MYMSRMFSQVTTILFRASIAAIFLWFGFQAVIDPQLAADVWVRAEFQNIITTIVPINIFMSLFGVLQIVVGLAILSGVLLWYALIVAAALVVGIIVNLGVWTNGAVNEIALRDIVILCGILFLLSETRR